MIKLKDHAYYQETIRFMNLSDEIEVIGKAAFSECRSLQTLKLPEHLKEIEMSAFYHCSSLESISIPKQVRTIGRYAFYGCESLKEFTVSQENAWFSSQNGMLLNKSGETLLAVPYGRYGELSEITVPSGILKIGHAAFRDFKNLKKVILPEGLEEIHPEAFKNCTNLTEVTFPESLYAIGKSAFYSCNIKNLVIPDTVTAIGKDAFSRIDYMHLEYRGVLLHAVKCKGVVKDYWECPNIKSVIQLVDEGDFSVLLTDEIKYSIIKQLLEKEKYHDFFRKYICSVMQWLIDKNEKEMVHALIYAGTFLNAENIDEIIRYAIEKEKYEIQLMLTAYKEKYIGYRNITEILKL